MLSFETRSWARFNFYAYERPFMHCLYFVGERKCYARSHVEFTRHWKSTLTEIAPKSPFFCVNRNPIRCGFRADSKAIRYSMNKALNYLVITPRGGGGTAIYGLYWYVPLWRVWFSSNLLWNRVYKSECLGLEYGIIFRKLISWLKILSRLWIVV